MLVNSQGGQFKKNTWYKIEISLKTIFFFAQVLSWEVFLYLTGTEFEAHWSKDPRNLRGGKTKWEQEQMINHESYRAAGWKSWMKLSGSSWWSSLVAQMVKHLPTTWETQVRSLGWEDPLEKEMATHSSTLAWKIPWMEEHCRLQSMGSQRGGHNWPTSLRLHFMMK